jgi:hypothetical protein
MDALWPFQGHDPRLKPEPGVHPSGRYPFSDKICARLASYSMSDDVLLLIHETMADAEMPDLDAAMTATIASCRAMDARTDIKLADFIEAEFRHRRLFLTPTAPAPDLIRELALRLLALPAIEALGHPAQLAAELDKVMEGYAGTRMELPIGPRVGRHFGLEWWSEGMTYRRGGSRSTYPEYVVDQIRWTQWRP